MRHSMPTKVIQIAFPSTAVPDAASIRFFAMTKMTMSKMNAMRAMVAPIEAKQVANPETANSRMCARIPQRVAMRANPAARE